MADSFVQLSPDSSGKKMDTRTEGSNSEHRQVMVIGDPATNANVAPVDATKGLAVDLSATGANSTKLLVTPDLPSGAATAAKQPALGTAGTASADVISIQGIASMTKLLVTPDANSAINQAQVAGTTTSVNNGTVSAGTQRVTIASDSSGNIATIGTSVTPGTAAANLGKAEDAAHVSGDTGVAVLAVRDDTLNPTSGTEGDYEMLHTTADGALWVTQAPSTSNGWSTFMASSGDGSTALTATAQAVKASAGTLGGWYIYNPNATATYVIIYNTAQGSVTVGTTNPQMVLCIPATSAANVEFGNGINFTTAISVAATTTGGGNTAPSTALEANFYYK